MNVRQTVLRFPVVCAVLLWALAGLAEDGSGIPQHEREIAEEKGFERPAETMGSESSLVLGSIALKDYFPALDGRMLQASVVTLLPGRTVY